MAFDRLISQGLALVATLRLVAQGAEEADAAIRISSESNRGGAGGDNSGGFSGRGGGVVASAAGSGGSGRPQRNESSRTISADGRAIVAALSGVQSSVDGLRREVVGDGGIKLRGGLR